jgi:hypothetical protein
MFSSRIVGSFLLTVALTVPPPRPTSSSTLFKTNIKIQTQRIKVTRQREGELSERIIQRVRKVSYPRVTAARKKIVKLNK